MNTTFNLSPDLPPLPAVHPDNHATYELVVKFIPENRPWYASYPSMQSSILMHADSVEACKKGFKKLYPDNSSLRMIDISYYGFYIY